MASSFYKTFTVGGKVYWPFQVIWSCKIPPTVRLFEYFMLQGKILTRDVLRRRGMTLDLICVACADCRIESIVHLLFLCPFAVSVWFHIATLMNRPIMKIAGTVHQIWRDSWQLVKSRGRMSKKKWAITTLALYGIFGRIEMESFSGIRGFRGEH